MTKKIVRTIKIESPKRMVLTLELNRINSPAPSPEQLKALVKINKNRPAQIIGLILFIAIV